MKMKARSGSGWLVGFSVAIASVGLVACGSSSGPGGGAGGASATGGTIGTGAGGALGAGGVTTAAGGAGGTSTSASCHAVGTLQVAASGMTAYVIDGVSNPDLTFCRASTYVFAVSAPGHPFYIKSVQGTGTGNAYSSGVTGNGTTSGDVTFVFPSDAPDTLFYNCSIHAAMTGTIYIVD